MTLREQFEKETKDKVFDASFGSVDRAYIQWLEKREQSYKSIIEKYKHALLVCIRYLPGKGITRNEKKDIDDISDTINDAKTIEKSLQ